MKFYFYKVMQKIYPLISLTFLEVSKTITFLEDLQTVLPTIIQLLIGSLTVIKLIKDIKTKNSKKDGNKPK